jgi:hypothetical protein
VAAVADVAARRAVELVVLRWDRLVSHRSASRAGSPGRCMRVEHHDDACPLRPRQYETVPKVPSRAVRERPVTSFVDGAREVCAALLHRLLNVPAFDDDAVVSAHQVCDRPASGDRASSAHTSM